MTVSASKRSVWSRCRRGALAVLAFAGYLALAAVAVAVAGGSVTSANGYDVMQSVAALGLVSLGLGLTVLIAEFDLSVAAMTGLGGMLAVISGESSPLLGVLIAAGAGLAVGAAQGCIIAWGRFNSMAVTLGTLLLLSGATQILSNSQSLDYGRLDVAVRLDNPVLVIFSLRSLIVVAIFIGVGLVLAYSRLGPQLRATGGHREGARVAGLRVDHVVIGVFATSGLLCALSGALLSYSLASAAPDIGTTPLLFAATAVLLGGVKLSGGEGSALGILLGVLALAVLQEVLAILLAPDFAVDLITGGSLLAVVIATSASRLRDRHRNRAAHDPGVVASSLPAATKRA